MEGGSLISWGSALALVYDLIIIIFYNQVHCIIIYLDRLCNSKAIINKADIIASIYCNIYKYLSI
jgi:hypothetical protein